MNLYTDIQGEKIICALFLVPGTVGNSMKKIYQFPARYMPCFKLGKQGIKTIFATQKE